VNFELFTLHAQFKMNTCRLWSGICTGCNARMSRLMGIASLHALLEGWLV